MDFRITALIAASLFCSAVFVGCSCTKSISNEDVQETNQIELDKDVTLSSKNSTTTTRTEYVTTASSLTETTTDYEYITTESTTSRSVKIQYVGNPGGHMATTKPVTQIVIVTVTTVPETTSETVTEVTETSEIATIATQNMPDAQFIPANDMLFTKDDLTIKVGTIHNTLSSYAQNYTLDTPQHGGSAAYSYEFGGDLTVKTEYLIDSNGVAGEVITEIILRSDKVCTNKGIKPGSSIDEIYAAYGTEKCIIDAETNSYSYRTDDGYIMEFYTDGSFVTEIKYRMENQQ